MSCQSLTHRSSKLGCLSISRKGERLVQCSELGEVDEVIKSSTPSVGTDLQEVGSVKRL